MAWQSWTQTHNQHQPFTLEQWTDGAAQVESGITSSPYTTHEYWQDFNRAYYTALTYGLPYVCCGLPTHMHGHIVNGEIVDDIHSWYCSKCNTLWTDTDTPAKSMDSLECHALAQIMRRANVRRIE